MSFFAAAIAALASRGLVLSGLLASGNYGQTVLDPQNAFMGIEIDPDGTWQRTNNTGVVDSGDWVIPNFSGVGADYEVRTQITAGALFQDDSAGSWVSLGSTRGWAASRGTIGTQSGTFDLEIRRASDSVVVVTRTYTLSATVDT